MKDYKDFKGIHQGQKIVVCGLGKSTLTLEKPKDYITIGVNDIGRLFCPDYLVVLNDKKSFLAERWGFIERSMSPTIFTHLKHLAVDEERKCVFKLGKNAGTQPFKDTVDFTSNSPYVGCIIAAYMGATKIGLLGVDFTKDHFFRASGEHSLARKLNMIDREYNALQKAMHASGVQLVNLSQESRLTLPKMRLEDF